MEATGAIEIVQTQVETKVEEVVTKVEEVVTTVEAQVDEVVLKTEEVEKNIEEAVQQVDAKVDEVVDLVEKVYLNLKAQFDGQTSLPVCVLKVMSEVEKLIPKKHKKQVAIAVVQKILPNIDADAVVTLIDTFIQVAKAPGTVQSNDNKQPKGCCICM